MILTFGCKKSVAAGVRVEKISAFQIILDPKTEEWYIEFHVDGATKPFQIGFDTYEQAVEMSNMVADMMRREYEEASTELVDLDESEPRSPE